MMPHRLSLRETAPYTDGQFLCNLCWELGSGEVYHCSDCDFDLHVTCAASAKQQTHFIHSQHPLHLCLCSIQRICDGCGGSIRKFAFRCRTCDFDMHSLCVRAPRFIVHPSHAHPLTLIKSSDYPGTCNACEGKTSDFSYHCHSCNYRLDQFCATIPSQIKHMRHPQHMLKLLWKPDKQGAVFKCDQCGRQGKSWCYCCSACGFYVHPGCSNLLHELPHLDLEVLRSNATASSSLLVQSNVLGVPRLSLRDFKAVEKVLHFARDINNGLTKTSPDAMEICENEEQDTCPTCLEGYDVGNPKVSTSCGHHFHLPCILMWMERSHCCPICRKTVNIMM